MTLCRTLCRNNHIICLVYGSVALSMLLFQVPASSQLSGIKFMESASATSRANEFKGLGDKRNYRSSLKFVFTAGLEGSGHHLMGKLVQGSPDLEQLREWNLWNDLGMLQQLLFNATEPSKALWNAHCAAEYFDENDSEVIDLALTEKRIVELLREMEQKAKAAQKGKNGANHHRSLHVPINTVRIGTYGTMMSYPTLGGPCRSLNVPNLDLLYHACDEAQVDCGHVYTYRDPQSILYSTTIHRRYNKHVVQAMQMYTSHLLMISSEIHAFPQQTWGCYGLLNNDKNRSVTATMWNELGHLWGWENTTEFHQFLKEKYKAPKVQSPDVVDDTLKPYLESMARAHHRTIRTCEHALSGNSEYS